jgi:hypothetical protein
MGWIYRPRKVDISLNHVDNYNNFVPRGIQTLGHKVLHPFCIMKPVTKHLIE